MGTREKSEMKTMFISLMENSHFFCMRSELKHHDNFHEGSYDTLSFFIRDLMLLCSQFLQN